MHLDALKRLIKRAAAAGARQTALTRWEWDIAGSCEAPVTRELFARKDRGTSRDNPWAPGDDMPSTLVMHLKCRHCQDCKRLRRREWVLRSGVELSRSTRVWFGTLTLSPDAHFRCEVFARKRLLRGGTVWKRLRPETRYGETCQEIGAELTRYLKRIRKESGARLKYMVCFEKHRSGFPHLHMLVHEYIDGGSVKKRHLDEQWKLGFSHWRLIPPEEMGKAAMYVAKYITKDGGRVRSSIRYGKPHVLRHSVPQGTACAEHSRPHPSASLEIGDKVASIIESADW